MNEPLLILLAPSPFLLPPDLLNDPVADLKLVASSTFTLPSGRDLARFQSILGAAFDSPMHLHQARPNDLGEMFKSEHNQGGYERRALSTMGSQYLCTFEHTNAFACREDTHNKCQHSLS